MERVIGGFYTRKDANYVIRCVHDIIDEYGQATMEDVKDLAGLVSAREDREIAWTEREFDNAVADPDINGGYVINLLTDKEMTERRARNGICIFI